MGLSNEERKSGIYWGLYRLNRLVREWKECKDKYPPKGTEEILDLLDKLWHSFLCDQSNGIHWFMGSSSSNTIHCDGGNTPWEVAMIEHCSKVYKPKDYLHPDREKPYDAMEMLTIPYLLHDTYEGWSKSYVFQVYQEMENLVYYLRRYKDDFMEGYPELNASISKIMGLCFEIFASEEDYAKAYVIHEMMKIMYGPRYPYSEDEWDIVTKIMSKHNIHHDAARLMKWQLKDLAVHHVALVKAYVAARKRLEHKWIEDAELLQLRMTLICEFSHSLHEYKHTRKAVLDELVDSTLNTDIPAFAILLEKKAVEFEKNKKNKDSEGNDEYLRNELNAYGYQAYSEMYDLMEGLEEQVPIPEPVPVPKKKKEKKCKK